jgi:intracellular septation protein
MSAKTQMNPLLKFVLEFGPLLLFFWANAKPQLFAPLLATVLPANLFAGEQPGIFAATAVFMVAVLVSLVIFYVLTKRLPVMPVVSAVVVVVFGGLTLFLQSETFIKLKPTIIYVLFAAALFGGLWFNKPLLAIMFDAVFTLKEEGWRKLTLRWAVFFLAMAMLNEIVWRTTSTDTWVSFKVFGVLPLTVIFAAFQYPLIQRYDASGDPEAEARDHV